MNYLTKCDITFIYLQNITYYNIISEQKSFLKKLLSCGKRLAAGGHDNHLFDATPSEHFPKTVDQWNEAWNYTRYLCFSQFS